MHQCIKLFYFWMTLYTFRTVFPSIIRSSRPYIQQKAFVKQILLSACYKQTAVSVWQMPVAVCTVLKAWWWTERLSETCRGLFKNKIIWYIGASGWFFYRNILRCTALWTSKKKKRERIIDCVLQGLSLQDTVMQLELLQATISVCSLGLVPVSVAYERIYIRKQLFMIDG